MGIFTCISEEIITTFYIGLWLFFLSDKILVDGRKQISQQTYIPRYILLNSIGMQLMAVFILIQDRFIKTIIYFDRGKMINNTITSVEWMGYWFRWNKMIKGMDIEIYKEECYCGLNDTKVIEWKKEVVVTEIHCHEEDITHSPIYFILPIIIWAFIKIWYICILQ